MKEQRKWPDDMSQEEYLFCTCCLHLEAIDTECADKVSAESLSHHHPRAGLCSTHELHKVGTGRILVVCAGSAGTVSFSQVRQAPASTASSSASDQLLRSVDGMCSPSLLEEFLHPQLLELL